MMLFSSGFRLGDQNTTRLTRRLSGSFRRAGTGGMPPQYCSDDYYESLRSSAPHLYFCTCLGLNMVVRNEVTIL